MNFLKNHLFEIFFASILVVLAMFFGCIVFWYNSGAKLNVQSAQTSLNHFTVEKYRSEGVWMCVIIDEETGVNYFSNTEGSVTPRYNADGTLYISERNEE